MGRWTEGEDMLEKAAETTTATIGESPFPPRHMFLFVSFPISMSVFVTTATIGE